MKNIIRRLSERRNADAAERGASGHNSAHDSDHKLRTSSILRKKSVLDPAPKIDHYRLERADFACRPSLEQLHEENVYSVDAQIPVETRKIPVPTILPKPSIPESKPPVKFGWIVGVLVRCILNILGAMLYLRLTWMAGQCGIVLATAIILISSLVTVLTTLSMCAICTNGEIKGGGAYFMLSRSLGPEFGGSMGLIFSLANALGAAMHVTGFSETVRDVMREHGVNIVGGGANDIRIIGVSTMCLLILIVLMGVDFEVKAQLVLLVILAVSYVNYLVGTVLPPTPVQQARGVTGYYWETFGDNFFPAFRGETFFSVFAIYFPASTGIMAGANISGDLKNPGKAIPRGTLLAILITTLMYLGGVWISGATVIRDASGNLDEINSTLTNCVLNNTCPYGLMNNFQTMEMQSAFGPLITAGIFAATLSSALACLVSGPKLFQAVGRDNLFPKIEWFAKGYGKSDEPRRAYILCFFISLAMACIGDLNTIAPLISNFYLSAYTLINFACFHGSLAKSPGWRPGFKFYNKWLSLLGAILCVAAMFLMGWVPALLTTCCIVVLYMYLSRRKPDVNWGSSNQAHQYKVALKSMLKLLHTEDHVKNYRPQVLVMTGNPVARPALVDFAASITKQNSLLVLGHVITDDKDRLKHYEQIRRLNQEVYQWLIDRRVKAFYSPVSAPSLREGFQILLQAGGLGKLKPNIAIFGFKHNWTNCEALEIREYFQLIHECLGARIGVGILRVPDGLDCSERMIANDVGDVQTLSYGNMTDSCSANFTLEDETSSRSSPVLHGQDRRRSSVSTCNNPSLRVKRSSKCRSITPMGTVTSAIFNYQPTPPLVRKPFWHTLKPKRLNKVQRQVLEDMNQFQQPIKEAVLDVYWLADDGGLTLLIPHLLTKKNSFLKGAKLRVFAQASNVQAVREEQKSMAALLEKFRIACSDVTVITDLNQSPKAQTVTQFETLIQPFRAHAPDNTESSLFITDSLLNHQQERTNRHLRTREILLENSSNSTFVVVTLSVPRKNTVSAYLYLAWLEMLTNNLPPVLLIRGNQQSVLTFYS